MPGLKKFEMGGVDLASNDLTREQLRASDLRNVIKNQKGDITGRNGYEETDDLPYSVEEIAYHKSSDQDIYILEGGLIYKKYNGAYVTASIAKLSSNPGNIIKNRIVTDEYLSNTYITTNDGDSRVIKFDGSTAYLAGMPAPNVLYDGITKSDISFPGGTYYFRYFYGHKDINGNETFGPYVQRTSSKQNGLVTVSTHRSLNPFGDFHDRYMIVPVTGVDYLVNSVNNKFPYTVTNYNVGDKFLIDEEPFYFNVKVTDVAGRTSKAVTIIAIDATYVYLDPVELGTFTFVLRTIGVDTTFNFDGRTKLYLYTSRSASYGYIGISNIVFTADQTNFRGFFSYVINNSINNQSFIISATPDERFKFEDMYNEEQQKLPPPRCKYLTAYGDQLIFGNILGVWDQNNRFIQYNNDDLVIPSDFGIGDNGENHSANYQRIGESYDGTVNGLKRCNDLLIVTKENSIYALDGIIEPGGYTLRKVPTNYTGCLSHNSLLQIQGGLFFHGNDGIYFTDGTQCYSTSDLIEPFFNTIIPERTKATVSRSQQGFMFYMTDGTTHYCLVYMHKYKEWFIWDNLDMSKGLYEKNNGDLVFAKNDSLYKFNSSFSDNGVSINHSYTTNWEDLKEPSVDKKFKTFRLWNLNPVPTSYKVSIQKDWNSTILQEIEVTLPASGTLQKGFEQRNCQAVRFIFQNNKIDENMIITGYELEYEASQKLDKGGTNGAN